MPSVVLNRATESSGSETVYRSARSALRGGRYRNAAAWRRYASRRPPVTASSTRAYHGGAHCLIADAGERNEFEGLLRANRSGRRVESHKHQPILPGRRPTRQSHIRYGGTRSAGSGRIPGRCSRAIFGGGGRCGRRRFAGVWPTTASRQRNGDHQARGDLRRSVAGWPPRRRRSLHD